MDPPIINKGSPASEPDSASSDPKATGLVQTENPSPNSCEGGVGDAPAPAPQTKSDETPSNVKTQSVKPKKSASTGKKKGKQSKGPTLEELKRRGRDTRQHPHQDNIQIMDKMADLSMKSMKLTNLGTGLIYDHFMTQHRCEWDLLHPECPDRITEPYLRCLQYGLVTRCVPILPKKSVDEAALSQHSPEYLKLLKDSQFLSEIQPLQDLSEKYHGIYFNSPKMTSEKGHLPEHFLPRGVQTLQDLSGKYDSIYFNSKTFECAQLSLGSTIEMTEQILQEKVRNGFAIVRPPGHHAMYKEACGYCFFNNVAIAAKRALDKFGLERVLIVDWDVHHGQGTQYMFYDDPRVMYVSIHRYEYGNFWPNLRESDYDYIGEGRGTGYNINIPLNKTGMTNSDYMAVFHQLLMPIFYEYNPQLVLVSSGYDAAIGCPEGEMEVTPACYAHFINMLSALADGKLAVILEGGYCLKSLSEGVALTLRALLGDPTPRIGPLQQPNDVIKKTILNAIRVLRPYWQCLQFQGVLPVQSAEVSSTTQEDEHLRTVPFSTPENRPEVYPIDECCYPVQEPEVKATYSARIQELIDNTYLGKAPHRTALVYDEVMRKHKNHVDPGHPERPDRITKIYNKIQEYRLLKHCLRVESRMATDEEVLTCHKTEHFKKMQQIKETKPRELKEVQLQYNSVYLCQESYDCALLAVGSLLNVVEAVLTNKSQNGVAVIRPPGHHAEINQACGFCLFNNVAIAARYAQKTFGVKKVLILDWDVHHGNGIQHIFEDDPSVLYISIHRYDQGFFFPAGPDGNYDKVGNGAGAGFNINIPWNKYGMGDAEYIAAFLQVIMPVAYEFDPDLVLVSAGFDAARGDPLGHCDITPAGYGHMTQMLMSLANGRVILALEGGYNLHSISESMAMCTKVLLGGTCPPLGSLVPKTMAVESICNVLDTHKKYWKCLQFRVDLPAPVLPVTAGVQNNAVTSTSDMDSLTTAIGALQVKYESVSSSSDGGSFLSSPTVTSSDCTGDSPLGACGGSEAKNLTVRELLGGALADQDDLQMFAVVPLPWCEHLKMVAPPPERGLDVFAACSMCESTKENWVCLTCYEVCCGRYVNEHMLFHGLSTEHKMVLSYSDLSVWCYGCDAYIHNEIIVPHKRAAHRSKFGEDIPGV
ncbi:LOW QUALITY PROTEIN: histone deacetylase 6-like [Lingula anatina]|uniref:Protein deacetylase HDAC6 n=1 Tax=Lingula anatina TaxID=7574 RepID=A0A1S3JEN4_LINAN|nr:LOW QUALITY PROTEIN: histone deacetylase 6-like [Lingula anatina]|eukprot:XP_013408875.1 LOW QUALITY PROTEIN: histone deacetylase 6-like [Lingula anatina]